MLAAQAELIAAKDALEWLDDEWRHLWPLAPEEILGLAGMETHPASRLDAELSIIGNYVMRSRTELTTRLSKRHRRKGGQTCFSVDTPDELAERLKRWRANKPVGRTAKTLARNRANRARIIAELEEKLPLSHQYYAETRRLRKASGVGAALLRQKIAKAAYQDAEAEIGQLPAFTMTEIAIKAAALKAAYEKMGMQSLGGILGDSYRLAEAMAALDALPASGMS